MEKISSPGADEMVVLLHEDGQPSGTALKSDVHDTSTPLHLAFSCYLLDPQGRVLVTRRALTKRTWPGVWTNSCAAIPDPVNTLTDALARRAREELGAEVEEPRLALPDFRYRAVGSRDRRERDLPGRGPSRLAALPSRAEVMDIAWVAPLDLAAAIRAAGFAFSPWLRMQLPPLVTRGSLLPRSET